jgi:L-serine dehydratase
VLYGSLAHTGHGHGTDVAILLGLEGETPDHIDISGVPARVHAMRAARELSLLGRKPVHFDPDRELIFNRIDLLPVHSNGMRFSAFDAAGAPIAEREMYSIGGGFVVDTDEAFVGSPRGVEQRVPYHFESMDELLALAVGRCMSCWANDRAARRGGDANSSGKPSCSNASIAGSRPTACCPAGCTSTGAPRV